MTPFQVAEKALIQLCDDAAAAGDHDAHAALFDALQKVRAVGGWKAFPPALKKGKQRRRDNKRARRLLMEFQSPERCSYCAAPGGIELHADHVIPVCAGGKDDVSNLVWACGSCNRSKGGRTPEQAGMVFQ